MTLRMSFVVLLLVTNALVAQDIEWSPASPVRDVVTTVEMVAENTMLCATEFGQIYRSTDDGITWAQLKAPVGGSFRFVPLRSDGEGNVFAICRSVGLIRSTDFGSSWLTMNKVLSPPSQIIAFIIAQDGKFIIGDDHLGLHLSMDAGDTWNVHEDFNSVYITKIFQSKKGDIFVATKLFGLFRTQDNCKTWESIGLETVGTNSVFTLAESENGQLLFAANESGLFRSSNGGETWLKCDRENALDSRNVTCFADDGSGRFFVGTDGASLLVSLDKGLSWRPVQRPAPVIFARAITITSRGYLVIGSMGARTADGIEGGIHRSILPITDGVNYSELRGRVFDDLDADCKENTEESGLASRIIRLEPGPYFGITNSYGNFVVRIPPGDYSAELVPRRHWQMACPPQKQYIEILEAGEVVDDIDFAHSMIPGIEEVGLSVSSTGQARPGAEITYHIRVRNTGTVAYYGSLKFSFDPLLSYQSAEAQPEKLKPGLAVFLIEHLPIDSDLELKVRLSIPPYPALTGRTVCVNVLLEKSSSSDLLRGENFDEDCLEIRNSYDPNDIQVEPSGTGPQGLVPLNEQILAYTIRFQNLGNAEAIDIRVLDTLDENLNIESLRLGAASHDYTLAIHGADILEFRFDNINLPDNKSDEPGSHGFLKYTIHMQPDLAVGTQIRNRAGIYFDFNPPVITNTALTTLHSSSTSIAETAEDAALFVYPNPAGNQFLVGSPSSSLADVKLFDCHGREISCTLQRVNNGIRVSSAQRAAGMYILRIETSDGVVVTRLQILQKR